MQLDDLGLFPAGAAFVVHPEAGGQDAHELGGDLHGFVGAFAEGVGRGIEKVNAENAKEWDFSLIGQELTPQDVARINAMRGYQAKATQQLNQVLAEGLADVAEKVAGMLLDKLIDIPGKLLKDVAGQVAGQLVKRNYLLAIFNEAVAEAGKSIPAGRAKVEKLAFHFVATAYLNQMQNKELQKKLPVFG